MAGKEQRQQWRKDFITAVEQMDPLFIARLLHDASQVGFADSLVNTCHGPLEVHIIVEAFKRAEKSAKGRETERAQEVLRLLTSYEVNWFYRDSTGTSPAQKLSEYHGQLKNRDLGEFLRALNQRINHPEGPSVQQEIEKILIGEVVEAAAPAAPKSPPKRRL